LDRRQGGPQSLSDHGVEEKNSQLLPGFEPPIIQATAQRCITEISRLHNITFRKIINCKKRFFL
jgi:hypothetical protein